MKKTVLITGATSGIGKACAQKFALEGWNLITTGRRGDRLELLKSQYPGSNITTLCFDVRNREETTNSLKKVTNRKVDLLINNAGLAVGVSPIDEGKFEDWDRMIDTNVKG